MIERERGREDGREAGEKEDGNIANLMSVRCCEISVYVGV